MVPLEGQLVTTVLASASPTFPVLPALIVVPLLGALLVIVVPAAARSC